MQLRCNLSSFSVGRGTKKEREGERGRENGGKESLFVVACRLSDCVDVDVSDGRTDGRRRNSGEGGAESGLHFSKPSWKRKISPLSDLPYQVMIVIRNGRRMRRVCELRVPEYLFAQATRKGSDPLMAPRESRRGPVNGVLRH